MQNDWRIKGCCLLLCCLLFCCLLFCCLLYCCLLLVVVILLCCCLLVFVVCCIVVLLSCCLLCCCIVVLLTCDLLTCCLVAYCLVVLLLVFFCGFSNRWFKIQIDYKTNMKVWNEALVVKKKEGEEEHVSESSYPVFPQAPNDEKSDHLWRKEIGKLMRYYDVTGTFFFFFTKYGVHIKCIYVCHVV